MGGSNPSSIVFLLAAAAMFYVLVIRPQQKRAKAQAEMLTTLNPGVEIVTIGGIFGTIVEVNEDRLRIRVADGSELEIARRAVGSIVPAEDAPDDEADAGTESALAETPADDSTDATQD